MSVPEKVLAYVMRDIPSKLRVVERLSVVELEVDFGSDAYGTCSLKKFMMACNKVMLAFLQLQNIERPSA